MIRRLPAKGAPCGYPQARIGCPDDQFQERPRPARDVADLVGDLVTGYARHDAPIVTIEVGSIEPTGTTWTSNPQPNTREDYPPGCGMDRTIRLSDQPAAVLPPLCTQWPAVAKVLRWITDAGTDEIPDDQRVDPVPLLRDSLPTVESG